MITQAITISGSRGHLGGALARVLALYRSGSLPLAGVVTDVLDGLDALLAALRTPEAIVRDHCKILVRLVP
jgi:(R,R)-butanediol dehydrogenase/meso-butanediol dehydrogenase/diacetyl reductase